MAANPLVPTRPAAIGQAARSEASAGVTEPHPPSGSRNPSLRHLYRQRCRPEIERCRLRFAELRHTAVTRLHESGVDDLGISGVNGHTPATAKAILDRHYLIRTEKAAKRAFRMRLAADRAEQDD